MTFLRIIIPAKNEGKYLPKLLDSIKKQKFKNLEVVVADAGSTDNTKKIAKSYKCKIVKGGMPDEGRNNGTKAITKNNPDIFVFIDSDALLPSNNFLKKAIGEFNLRKLDVAGTIQKPSKTRNQLKNLIYGFFYWLANLFMSMNQNTKNPLMQNCMFAKKETHRKIGGFKALEFGEDSKYAKDAVEKGYKFGILKTPGKILISPRRFENKGLIRMMRTYIYYNTGRLFGREFVRKGKGGYFD